MCIQTAIVAFIYALSSRLFSVDFLRLYVYCVWNVNAWFHRRCCRLAIWSSCIVSASIESRVWEWVLRHHRIDLGSCSSVAYITTNYLRSMVWKLHIYWRSHLRPPLHLIQTQRQRYRDDWNLSTVNDKTIWSLRTHYKYRSCHIVHGSNWMCHTFSNNC